MIKQSVTLEEEDRDLLKLISMGNPKYKGKVSTGIKMLCNIFRSIAKENGASCAKAQPQGNRSLKIGEFEIFQSQNCANKIWVCHESGESGQFNKNSLEKMIKKWYGENF